MSTKTKSTKTETVAYVGPTILGVAAHNTFYNNGLPDALQTAVEAEPAFNNLIVPISGLGAALASIKNKSGATWVFYQKAQDYTP